MEGIKIDDDRQLILFNPGDVFKLESILEYMEILRNHKKDTSDYYRFINFSLIKGAKFKYPEFERLIDAIKEFRSENPDAKCCFYYNDLAVEKLANLVIARLKPDFTCYMAFDNIEKCADYLNVSVSLLSEWT